MNVGRSGLVVFKIVVATLFLSPLLSQASNVVLKNCFNAPANYYVNGTYELSPTENQKGKTLSPISEEPGSGPPLTAQCDCPAALTSNSVISDIIYVTSPLPAGATAGYGYLTDKLDVDVDTFTNAEGATSQSDVYYVSFNTYPTTTPISKVEPKTSVESESTVCKPGTQPVPGTPQRQFLWNVLSAKFYIKAPILGVEAIPQTLVVQTAVCVYSGGGCTASASQPAASIWLSGAINAPLGCTINAGGTIEVVMGDIISSNFVHSGAPPEGFTLKNVDISLHCDNPGLSNTDKVKITLSADQGVSDSGSGLIAKMVDRDDIGVRMYDTNHNSVRLDGNAEFPVTLDSQGNGAINMQAAPVSTTDKTPAAGPFEGNVTVKMEIK